MPTIKGNQAVLVPIYKKNLSSDEIVSIKLMCKILRRHKIIFICPLGLDITHYIENYLVNCEFVFFPEKHFKSVATYSKLLLSIKFYEQFEAYKYILVFQLDALVFKDSLNYWVAKHLDYIGAPIFQGKNSSLKISGVQNGGISLRRVQSCLKVLNSPLVFLEKKQYDQLTPFYGRKNIVLLKSVNFFYKITNKFLKIKPVSVFLYFFRSNEDFFWSIFAKYFYKSFKTASVRDSLSFAFEKYPERCYQLNENKWPFGAHAWTKYNRKFYTARIKQLLRTKS